MPELGDARSDRGNDESIQTASLQTANLAKLQFGILLGRGDDEVTAVTADGRAQRLGNLRKGKDEADRAEGGQ